MLRSEYRDSVQRSKGLVADFPATECENPKPQLAEWNDCLGKANEHLASVVERLLVKLKPVMRENAKNQNEEDIPHPALVPLADLMRSHCIRIIRISDELEDAIKRIEL